MRTAVVIARLKLTSSWIAFTRSTDGLAVGGRVELPHQPVAVEDRQREVAPAALGRRLVHLERVLELEQLLGPHAIVDEPVEGRQQRRPSPEAVVQVRRVDAPLALHALDDGRLPRLADVDRLHRHRPRLRPRDAEGREPALVPDPLRLLDRRDLDVGRIDALGQVP